MLMHLFGFLRIVNRGHSLVVSHALWIGRARLTVLAANGQLLVDSSGFGSG